jgi:crotonobetainyl-CoA:carnitine CoA-transferase CaiB-like acyl-CoA transferase
VLQITSPYLPSILPLVMDTGFGKYAASLDLTESADRQTLLGLVENADVFVQAYRPGGLAAKGFSAEALAKPGIIYVELSAYSHQGPWAHRHGYDSLVQTATGIAHEQSEGQAKPQHLPAQSLDYLSGYLAAFATLEALRRRATEGGSYLVRLSLAQTGHWFNALGRVRTDFKHCKNLSTEDIKEKLVETATPFGRLQHLAPVLKLSETPPLIGRGSVPLGSDPAVWA